MITKSKFKIIDRKLQVLFYARNQKPRNHIGIESSKSEDNSFYSYLEKRRM